MHLGYITGIGDNMNVSHRILIKKYLHIAFLAALLIVWLSDYSDEIAQYGLASVLSM